MIGNSALLRGLDRIAGGLARIWPSMFSYQFLVEATRLDTDRDIADSGPANTFGGGSGAENRV